MLPWSVPSWRLPACPTREWGSRSCTFSVRILLRALPLSCSFTPVCSRDHMSQPYQSLRRYLNIAREKFHGRLVEARASSRLCPAGGPAYSFHGYDSIVCTSPCRAGTKQSDGIFRLALGCVPCRGMPASFRRSILPGLDHRVGFLVSMRAQEISDSTPRKVVPHQPPPVPPSLGGGVGGRGWAAWSPTTGARAASSILWASRVHVFARSGSARPAPAGLHMWDARPSCRRGFPGPTAVVLTPFVVGDVRMRAWARWR